jgi:hypothetical protein
MNIQYFEPLSRGFARMKTALFSPFDIKIWFVVGFTAFLAGNSYNCGFQGPMNFNQNKGRASKADLEQILYFPQKAWEWLGTHPAWTILICSLVFVGFLIGLLFGWLNSRFRFMFLDNVVRNRALVAAPWKEYRNEANSFFVFSFLLGLVGLVVVVAYVLECMAGLQSLYESSGEFRALIGPAILAGGGLLAIILVGGFINFMLGTFVVPIMYRDRSNTTKAVQKFFSLFLSNFFYFIGFAIFMFCLVILIGIGLLTAGCATCCIGLILLMIPYISAVVTLPISYAMRAFSVEFLEQFGPEYHVFPRPEINPPDAQPITV